MIALSSAARSAGEGWAPSSTAMTVCKEQRAPGEGVRAAHLGAARAAAPRPGRRAARSWWLIDDGTPRACSIWGRFGGHDLVRGRCFPSSRPQNRVCGVHAACRVAGAGSAGRGGDHGEEYQGKRPRPLAVLVRDRLGQWLHDEDFAAAFGARGRPGWSPSRLALVTVLQRAENLTDRQAAEAVRTRIDWQYLLGLAWDDPGFDHTVLAEFRPPGRRRRPGAGRHWTRCWRGWRPRGWSRRAGSSGPTPRTWSRLVAALNRLELAGESVRAVLEALAAACPDWLETAGLRARFHPPLRDPGDLLAAPAVGGEAR